MMMKKIVFLIGFILMFGLIAKTQEVGDQTIRNYNATYIKAYTNNELKAYMLNQLYDWLIDSKVNIDSATSITYYNGSDTVIFQADGVTDTIVFGGITDHGGLTGLGDDDHPQYQLDSDTTTTDATKYDLDTLGRVTTWSPSLVWTGGTPVIDSSSYTYSLHGNMVFYDICIWGINETGGDVTGLTVTMPYTVKQITAKVYPVYGYRLEASNPDKLNEAYIDAMSGSASDRILKHHDFDNLANSASFAIIYSGWYEAE